MLSERTVRFGVEELRRRLERIDRTIVELLAVRIAQSATIIRERRALGQNVTDLAQERTVHARAETWARELGIPIELADRLFEALIAAGKDRFREQGELAPSMGWPAAPWSAMPESPPPDAEAYPLVESGTRASSSGLRESVPLEPVSETFHGELGGRPAQELERGRAAHPKRLGDRSKVRPSRVGKEA
jgi:chorismate mutase